MLSNNSPERNSVDSENNNSTVGKGTWTKEEHERFLKATELYPQGPWKKIAEMVRTRTIRQTQTHAQKYREKLARHHRGLRTRSFGQNATPSQSNLPPAPRHIPSGPRTTLLPPPVGHGLGSLSHHHHHQPPPVSRPPLSHHLPPHHHHNTMLWTPPQLPQLPVHESSNHHHYGSNNNGHSETGQNFSQSMQYLMDFYEPAVPQHHFPIEHNSHSSYTVYNEPVDIYRRHSYKNEP